MTPDDFDSNPRFLRFKRRFSREKFGAEAARAALAHQTLDMTALYAHRDLKAAAQVAKAIG